MASVYEPEKLKEEAARNMLMMDTAINLQAVIELLVAKGIIANVELNYMRDKLRNSPAYKTAYEMAQKMVKAAELYERDPQAYLRELLAAKMQGRV